MKKMVATAVAVVFLTGAPFPFGMSKPAAADCQEEVDELRKEIDQNKDDYSADARREAKRHLAAAELNRVNPVNCREDLRKARQALREGRREKKREK
ncbi:MAG TPA: hypothetical protein DEH27_00505 [Deltaproteobacteria bacterium]|nr:hypothetical protein [Deltaproteobacteria bacterium]